MLSVLNVVRPSDTVGGDQMAARWHAAALKALNVNAPIVKALSDSFLHEITLPYDFVHMWAGCSPDWGLPTARAAKEAGKKLIITTNWWSRERRQRFHGGPVDLYPGYTDQVAQTLSLADVLAVCAMSEAQECWKLIPRAKIYILGSGPGTVTMARQEPEDYVCCVGRIEPHKNQLTLAIACKKIHKPLVMVGPANEDYLDLILRNSWKIKVLGELSREAAQLVLSKARVHALPSFSETPGLSNSEALRLGVPAVMGNIGAECEFYRENGIYCTPENPDDIASAIEEAWAIRRKISVTVQTWDEAAQRSLKWMKANV